MNESPFRSIPPASADDVDDRTLQERVERLVARARRALPFWRGILGIFVVACSIALFLALNTQRVYRSECKILVKSGIRTSDRMEAPSLVAEKLAGRLREVLLTRTRLEPIIKQYNLYPSDVEGKGMMDAVEEMRTHIGLRASAENTFTISFEDGERERTKDVTQRLADTTIADFKRSSLSRAEQEVEFFSTQVSRAQEDLVKAEAELYLFHAAHPEFPVAVTPSGMAPVGVVTGPKVPSAPPDPVLADLYRRKAQIEAEANPTAKPVAPAGPSPEVAQATAARDDAAKRAAEAKTALNEKLASGLTEQHPDVGAAKAKAESAAQALKTAEAQLDKVKAAVVAPPPVSSASLSAEAQARMTELNNQIARRLDEMKRTSPALGKTGTLSGASPLGDWQRLTGDVNLRRLRYEDLQRNLKEKELEARASKGSEFLEVLEPAYLPSHPYRGGRTKTAITGFVVALLLALGYALIRVLFDDTVVDAEDLHALQRGINVIGVIPTLPRLTSEPPSVASDPEKR